MGHLTPNSIKKLFFLMGHLTPNSGCKVDSPPSGAPWETFYTAK